MAAAFRRALWKLRGRLHGVRRICAWCPGFDAADPKNAGASHGLCPSCAEQLKAEEV
jgi:hypothetical protein